MSYIKICISCIILFFSFPAEQLRLKAMDLYCNPSDPHMSRPGMLYKFCMSGWSTKDAYIPSKSVSVGLYIFAIHFSVTKVCLRMILSAHYALPCSQQARHRKLSNSSFVVGHRCDGNELLMHSFEAVRAH